MASIRQRGDKWQAQVRRKGVTPLVQSFLKYADAVKWARTIEATIDIGQEPPEASIMARTKFRQLLARYLAEVTPQKRSQRMETSRINRLLKHEMADMALDKLTSGVFASFRDQRLKKVGPQTVRHDLNLLGHIIKTATIDWDFPFKENPLDRLRKPAIPSGRIRRVSAEELVLMRAGMERSESTYLMPMVDFAIETAMRRGEILGLLWKHIDLERGTAHLPMTKNGHSRTVPLSSKARAILSGQPRRRVRVFPVTETAVRLAWDRLMRRAKIKDLHFHDLRHEAISRLFEKGLSIATAAVLNAEGYRRTLVLSPPHLVYKWRREIQETVAGAKVWVLKRQWYTQLMFAQHAANLAPVWGRSQGTGHPGITFFNRGGGPITFDPLNRLDRQMNAHLFLFGPTGSGKSATLNNILNQVTAIYRPRLFIVEAGNSFGLFGDFAARLGLKVHRVKLAPGAGMSLAPFADAHRLVETPSQVQTLDADALDEDQEAAAQAAIRAVVAPRQQKMNQGAVYTDYGGQIEKTLPNIVTRGAGDLGLAVGSLGFFPAMDVVRQALPMVLSLLKMALVICLPLVLLFGTYELKAVVTVSCVEFALFFVDFWFQLARWIDSTILDALYGWGFGANRPHTNFDPLIGLNNAFGDMLLNFVMATMFTVLPTFWVAALSWVGVRAGGMLQGLSDATRPAGQAGGKGPGVVSSKLR